MIARLRGLPYVAGVWLVGSLGRSDGDAASDVDLVVAVGRHGAGRGDR
jgi:predicted nucleotidyltransferase